MSDNMSDKIEFDRTRVILNLTSKHVNQIADDFQKHNFSVQEVMQFYAVITDSMFASVSEMLAEEEKVPANKIKTDLISTYLTLLSELHLGGANPGSANVKDGAKDESEA